MNITLEQLVNHLENGITIHKNFDFRTFNTDDSERNKKSKVKDCGTAGCALGEMPFFDKRWSFDSTYLLLDNEEIIPANVADYFNERLLPMLWFLELFSTV